MKTLFTTAAAIAGLMAVASASYAKDCNAVAQAAVDAQTHPAGSALIGCGVGAAIGSLLTNGKGGAVAGGCAAGGATGLVLSADKRTKIYNSAYAACIGNGPQAQPAAYTTYPPPSTSAVTTPNSTINVRNGPGTGYGVRETLPPSTAVSVAVCSSNNWCQVGGYSGPGWVAASLLTFN